MDIILVMKNITIVYPGDKTFRFQHPSTAEDKDLLELLFAEWNAGSCQECDLFLNGNQRSMSTGDFVCIDGNWYQCMSIGWEKTDIAHVNAFEQLVVERVKSDPECQGSGWCAAGKIRWELYKQL
jgi:hypothetical protein